MYSAILWCTKTPVVHVRLIDYRNTKITQQELKKQNVVVVVVVVVVVFLFFFGGGV